LRGRRRIWPAQSGQEDQWDDEYFMGDKLQLCAGGARFPRMELLQVDIYATFPEISHVFSGGAAKVLWTTWNRAATILITRI